MSKAATNRAEGDRREARNSRPLARPRWTLAWVAAVITLASALPAWAGGVVSFPTEQALRAALVGGGTVTFATSNPITVATPITISAPTTLDGAGATVEITGRTNVGIFRVASNVPNVHLLNLTLTGGKATNGGALFIQPGASVVVSNCVFRYNQAVGRDGAAGTAGANTTGTGGNGGAGGAGQAGLGGAVCNQGMLQLLACQFLTNSAFGGDGGTGGAGGSGDLQGGNGGAGGSAAAAYGGAVHNAGHLLASNCTFTANLAVGGNGGAGGAGGSGAFGGLRGSGGAAGAAGGGGMSSVATAILVNCTFADNSGYGGDSATAGQQTSGNGANGAAGGDAAGAGLWSSGLVAVTNCTFSANFVVGGNGAAGGAGELIGGAGGRGGHGLGGSVYNSGTNRFVNCTVADSSASGGTNGLGGSGITPGAAGAFGEGRGDNLANGGGTFMLKNSIIAYALGGVNAHGTFLDAGNNVSSDATPALGGNSHNHTDPLLGPLADNGGPTLTYALYADSPCVNAGDDAGCAPFDQRAYDRPWGGRSDIGAVELVGQPVIRTQPQSQTVTNGAPVTFTPFVMGEFPRYYQWRFNGTNLAGATDAAYAVASAQPTDVGGYSVVVVNAYGAVTSQVATLTIAFDLWLTNASLKGTNFTFAYPTRTGHSYRVEAKASLTNTGWTLLSTNSGTGGWLTNLVPVTGFPSRFFRVVEE